MEKVNDVLLITNVIEKAICLELEQKFSNKQLRK